MIMKMTKLKQKLSFILWVVLIAAMALFTTGCNDKTVDQKTEGQEESLQKTDETPDSDESRVVGEGDTTFMFTVADEEGNEESFEVHTDKTTVGDALQECGLISGEEGEYGLYVKEVGGITADYDKDGTYWAFYINDEYASTGVDSTDITEGDTYTFRVEK